MTMRQMLPSTIRASSGARNRVARSRDGAGPAGSGGGRGAPLETSASILDIRASASAVRPTDSSQRGLSGRFLRKYQTISAPTPPSTNSARQPYSGTPKPLALAETSHAVSAETGNPVTTKTAT